MLVATGAPASTGDRTPTRLVRDARRDRRDRMLLGWPPAVWAPALFVFATVIVGVQDAWDLHQQ